jgi:RNA polymerase sigma-70 factor (sigma-E family)
VEVDVDADVEREFTDFVAERTHALFRVAYALTGNQHAAEDLLQTALAKTFTKWRRISTDAEGYVKRILYRDWVSLWRWRSRRPETTTADVPERAKADGSEETVLRLVLRDALLALPPRQRAVVVLRYLDDLGEREVAEILGCSPGTVASQASRALAKLRRTMGSSALFLEVGSGVRS